MIHIWKYGQISSEISETKIQNNIYLNIWNGAKYILDVSANIQFAIL